MIKEQGYNLGGKNIKSFIVDNRQEIECMPKDFGTYVLIKEENKVYLINENLELIELYSD